jgi:hypothetical protein
LEEDHVRGLDLDQRPDAGEQRLPRIRYCRGGRDGELEFADASVEDRAQQPLLRREASARRAISSIVTS